MRDLFEKPKCVAEAANAKKGWNWAVEILVFVAVFIVGNIIMAMATLPIQIVLLALDNNYMAALESGDAAVIQDASMKMVSSDAYTICTLFADIVLIVVVCLFCKLFQARKMTTLGFCKKGIFKEYIIGAIAGFAFFSAAVLIGVITGALKIEGINASFSIWIFLLYTVGFMIQGMAEEVVCRGYFMVSFARRYPMWAAVLANSLVFAALHLGNSGVSVLALVNLTLFGIFASVYFIRRGNIWGVAAFHSIWNLVQGCFYGIKVSGLDLKGLLITVPRDGKELLNGGAFGMEGGIIVTIIFCIGIVILYFLKKYSEQEKPESR